MKKMVLIGKKEMVKGFIAKALPGLIVPEDLINKICSIDFLPNATLPNRLLPIIEFADLDKFLNTKNNIQIILSDKNSKLEIKQLLNKFLSNIEIRTGWRNTFKDNFFDFDFVKAFVKNFEPKDFELDINFILTSYIGAILYNPTGNGTDINKNVKSKCIEMIKFIFSSSKEKPTSSELIKNLAQYQYRVYQNGQEINSETNLFKKLKDTALIKMIFDNVQFSEANLDELLFEALSIGNIELIKYCILQKDAILKTPKDKKEKTKVISKLQQLLLDDRWNKESKKIIDILFRSRKNKQVLDHIKTVLTENKNNKQLWNYFKIQSFKEKFPQKSIGEIKRRRSQQKRISNQKTLEKRRYSDPLKKDLSIPNTFSVNSSQPNNPPISQSTQSTTAIKQTSFTDTNTQPLDIIEQIKKALQKYSHIPTDLKTELLKTIIKKSGSITQENKIKQKIRQQLNNLKNKTELDPSLKKEINKFKRQYLAKNSPYFLQKWKNKTKMTFYQFLKVLNNIWKKGSFSISNPKESDDQKFQKVRNLLRSSSSFVDDDYTNLLEDPSLKNFLQEIIPKQKLENSKRLQQVKIYKELKTVKQKIDFLKNKSYLRNYLGTKQDVQLFDALDLLNDTMEDRKKIQQILEKDPDLQTFIVNNDLFSPDEMKKIQKLKDIKIFKDLLITHQHFTQLKDILEKYKTDPTFRKAIIDNQFKTSQQLQNIEKISTKVLNSIKKLTDDQLASLHEEKPRAFLERLLSQDKERLETLMKYLYALDLKKAFQQSTTKDGKTNNLIKLSPLYYDLKESNLQKLKELAQIASFYQMYSDSDTYPNLLQSFPNLLQSIEIYKKNDQRGENKLDPKIKFLLDNDIISEIQLKEKIKPMQEKIKPMQEKKKKSFFNISLFGKKS